VAFALDKKYLGQVFLEALQFYPVNVIPLLFHVLLFHSSNIDIVYTQQLTAPLNKNTKQEFISNLTTVYFMRFSTLRDTKPNEGT